MSQIFYLGLSFHFMKSRTFTGPTKKKWRSDRKANRGKSRQIAAKFGKFRFKKNGDHFFKKSRRIASQRAIQKKMAIILEVKL